MGGASSRVRRLQFLRARPPRARAAGTDAEARHETLFDRRFRDTPNATHDDCRDRVPTLQGGAGRGRAAFRAAAPAGSDTRSVVAFLNVHHRDRTEATFYLHHPWGNRVGTSTARRWSAILQWLDRSVLK
jgi:hypothetical protein